MNTPLVIHQQAVWYQSNEAPEQTFRGVLRLRQQGRSPGGRDLPFFLELDVRTIDIYPGTKANLLEPFVDQEVEIRGKLVDLRPEGFGTELWPRAVTVHSSPAR